jgi:hypothetical protein
MQCDCMSNADHAIASVTQASQLSLTFQDQDSLCYASLRALRAARCESIARRTLWLTEILRERFSSYPSLRAFLALSLSEIPSCPIPQHTSSIMPPIIYVYTYIHTYIHTCKNTYTYICDSSGLVKQKDRGAGKKSSGAGKNLQPRRRT